MPIRALMIHGAGGGAWEWRIWQRLFEAAEVDCHALDLMPVGTVEQTRYEDYLEQVLAALARTHAEILVGASLGGLLAAEAAMLANPSVRALILVAPIPPFGLARSAELPVKRWAHQANLRRTATALPDADAASIAMAHRLWRDESGGVLNTAYHGRPFELQDLPTLLLIAELDQDLDAKQLRHWAQLSAMDVATALGCSHAGVLLGKHAAKAANVALYWIKNLLP